MLEGNRQQYKIGLGGSGVIPMANDVFTKYLVELFGSLSGSIGRARTNNYSGTGPSPSESQPSAFLASSPK